MSCISVLTKQGKRGAGSKHRRPDPRFSPRDAAQARCGRRRAPLGTGPGRLWRLGPDETSERGDTGGGPFHTSRNW